MPRPRNGRYAHLDDATAPTGSAVVDSNPELIGELVQAVLGIGDAVLFGVTRDGGSVRVILMSGDEKVSKYLQTGPDLDAFCKSVATHLRETYT